MQGNIPFIASLTTRELPGFSGVCLECRYREEFYTDDLFAVLGVYFPAQIRTAATVRKAAFLAGRLAAKHGLRALGIPEEVVGIGAHGEPLWPGTVSASISHCAGSQTLGMALCLLSRGEHRIGVDVEEVMSSAVLSEIKGLILSNAEQRYIATFHGEESSRLATIIFSAKECLYKALYPEVRVYFDFLDVETVKIDFTDSQITLRLLKSLSENLPLGEKIMITWQPGEKVVTYTPLFAAVR